MLIQEHVVPGEITFTSMKQRSFCVWVLSLAELSWYFICKDVTQL